MKTTKKNFESFKKEFNKYVGLFGLKDWDITFLHTKIDGAYADILVKADSSVATVSFNSNLCSNACKKDAKSSGKHEAIHLLLARLQCLTSIKNDYRANVESERIVRILEKVL